MGLTLVELMVSMVIGLAVIGAGLAMYSTSGFAGKGSSALSQMSEDASLALSLMRNHIAMAGYSRMVLEPTSNAMVKLYTGHPVFGCRFGVDSITKDNFLSSTDPDATKHQIACDNAAGTGNDTLIVLYEADQDNTVANTATTPTDCLGNGVPLVTTNPLGNYNIAENRFFISADNALSCRGNDGAVSQPLVDNVAQMQIWYGVATPSPTGTRGTVATRYLRANQVGDMNNGNWDQVVSIRLCLVIQSRDPVLDTPAPYFNCNGVSTPTTDRRLYRAFTTTVVLNNRIFQN